MRRFASLLALFFAAGILPAHSSSHPSSYRIAGIVVDSVTGQLLAGAEVAIAPVMALDQEQTYLTSADGRFVFAGLPFAKFRLTVGRHGYSKQAFHEHEGFSSAIVTGPGQDSEHIRFSLAPQSVVTGVVTDEAGDPVRNAKVLLFQQSIFAGSQSFHQAGQTLTDDQGRYRFPHLLPGAYSVAVYAHPWYAPDMNSRTFSQAFTSLQTETENSPDTAVVNDGEGSSLQPSSSQLFDVVYPVTFFPNATRLAEAARLSLAPGATETADVQLHTVPSIHLRITVPAEPSVEVSSEDNDGQETHSIKLATDVGLSLRIGEDFTEDLQPARAEIARGVFQLYGIPPGEISLIAASLTGSPEGSYVSRSRKVDLSGDTAIDLTLQGAPANVSGVVLAEQFFASPPVSAPPTDHPATYQPPSEAPSNLMLRFRSVQSGESFETSISAKGEFSLSGSFLPEGSYEVELVGQPVIQVSSVEAAGAAVSGRAVEIPAGQPVNLVIHTSEAKCTLSGFALKNGKPVAGAMVLLVPQDSGSGGPVYHRDQSDSDGSFSMAALFPGRYTLLAIENGWDLEWADPAVLFRYLPGGQQIEIAPGGLVTHSVKVQ